MSETRSGPLPELTPSEFTELLATAPLFVGIHSPVFDDDGSVNDFRLIWWNDF